MRATSTITDVSCDLCSHREENVVAIEYTDWVLVHIENRHLDICKFCSRQISAAIKNQKEKQTEVPF